MSAPRTSIAHTAPVERPQARVTTAAGSPGARRARLRADLALASRVLPVHYPLQAFIAVNPLGGLLEHRLDDALLLAGELYAAPGTLSESWFRGAYQAGRITDADLTAVLHERHPGLLDTAPFVVAGRVVTAWQLMRADLLHGAPAPAPRRQLRTRAEQAAPDIARTVDDLTGKWCAAYLGDPTWPMPGQTRGFYVAWRELAPYDRSLPRPVRTLVGNLPERADDAVLKALDLLGIAESDWSGYLRADLTRSPGWAAHARWRAEQPSGPGDAHRGPTLMEYLAMRLSSEALLMQHAGLLSPYQHAAADADPDADADAVQQRTRAALGALGIRDADETQQSAATEVLESVPLARRCLVWQQAFEGHYRERLLTQLSTPPVTRSDESTSPASRQARVQLVCCIDARSEGLRRHLESLDQDGRYETLGFAGFFAVAIRYTDLAQGAPLDLCPALIAPSTEIREVPSPDAPDQAARRRSGMRLLAGGSDAFHSGKDNLLSPFTLAEAGGVLAGPLAAVRTVAPGPFGALRRRLHRRAVPLAATELTVQDGFPLPERVLYAQVALTTMGLIDGFARLVVLCGHGSSTENNPYQAALDCGACGGHRGAPNARTAAAILNDPAVRGELPNLGITIPDGTVFVAGEHDTATDRVVLLDRHLLPDSHRQDLVQLDHDLGTAGARLAGERAADLPGASRRARRTPHAAARHTAGRSTDWAQVYPEWGLAGNAAFLVGPRSLSRGLDLGRRVFLHSYDPQIDPDGTALETILTAPLVVAQWINAQYYFSTVAPDIFGAGSKTIHNVIGGVGVLAGQTGDLRLGLPWQSVAVGDRLVHEPMRLLALVQAPLHQIEVIIDRNPILQQLFGNQWINLSARPDPHHPWQHYAHPGWVPWTPAATPSDIPAPLTQTPTGGIR